MAWLFKFSGLLIIFCVSALTGFLKSSELKKREQKLNSIYKGMSELKERIRIGAENTEQIVLHSFKGENIKFKNGALELEKDYLDKEDISLIKEFFENFGMSDSRTECERAEVYIGMLSSKCADAEKKSRELCKLYNTLGILCGIFICIFFL